jgi:hypothetical protein
MMIQVVCSVRQSIGAVYQAMSAEIGVSKTAVYDKLNRLEPNVSKALVKSTAIDLATIIEQLGVERSELLPGYRVKIRIGQWSRSDLHRLEVLRNTPCRSFTREISGRPRSGTGASQRYFSL